MVTDEERMAVAVQVAAYRGMSVKDHLIDMWLCTYCARPLDEDGNCPKEVETDKLYIESRNQLLGHDLDD